ncbi:hypothetical protein JWG39_08180 [Desulforhopalus vacuolatus]|uniref:hypothetical protein n=1 Tax=Desulforhopalus vacuolatus TaxID=40414 RepID=UPI0019656823|nr:hypothetical protein [Desulforhopalus vacuolatus]MBM9519794.1 hypothetical protein [Desulforhopalus vacuolatus]
MKVISFIRTSLFLLWISLLLVFSPDTGSAVQPSVEQNISVPSATADETVDTSRTVDEEKMLLSINELRQKLQKQIQDKIREAENLQTENDKAIVWKEIAKLQESMAKADNDFEKMATGVDTSKFKAEDQTSFDWKQELFDLMKPGIMELKQLTVQARRKAELLDQQDKYQELLPIAQTANKNLQELLKATTEQALKAQIQPLLPEWESLESQITNGLDIVNMELANMNDQQQTLLESSKATLKKFFRTRGLYLTIALVACFLIVFIFRFLQTFIRRMIPGHDNEYRPFQIRVYDLVFQVATLCAGLSAFILVFYVVEDWALLSFAIIILAGLAWATKTALPRFWQQSELMLNAGPVREGERLLLYGVPWLVKNINMRTTIENPDLGLTIKVPIRDLFDKTSRTFSRYEQWFPCRRDDWVILSDGTRGGVVALSHEIVELVLRGGSHKSYQTADFLGLAPLNLSRNFRIKEYFGIGYDNQADVTERIPKQLEDFILGRIEAEGHQEELLSLRVEFNAAGASSLDLVVIADFKGSNAPIYNRLRRAIQRWCVDACTQYGWDIPFPQLTIHRERSEAEALPEK